MAKKSKAYVEKGNTSQYANNTLSDAFRKNNIQFDNGDYENVNYLPQGYLKEGYFQTCEENVKLNSKYIVEYPREIAKKLSSEGNNKNKRSQIRKFYEYSLRIQNLLRHKKGDFCVIEAEFKRLIPFVEYAESRGTVTECFVSFITKNVEEVKNADDLNAFVKHFEAIVAYLPKEKN